MTTLTRHRSAPDDILTDPRYDSTPGVASLVVSRNPTYTGHSRKKLLRLLGLPSTATWEDANPVLKERIVSALRAGDEAAATYWNVIRDELEARLCHYCDCGTLISSQSAQCTHCKNKRLGLEARKPGWWRKHLHFRSQLGRKSDGALAREWHLGRTTVKRIREVYGIKPYDCFHGEDDGDREAYRRKWPAEVIAKLGTVPDGEIARLYGYCRFSVIKEREVRGIAPFRPQRKLPPLRKEHRALLGTMTDTALAALSGLPRETITYRRRKAGIPAYIRPAAASLTARISLA